MMALLALTWGALPSLADGILGERPEAQQPITVAAEACTRWQQGALEVWHIQKNCYFNQGLTYARGPEAVLWIERSKELGVPTKVIVYLEGNDAAPVFVDFQRSGVANADASLLGRQQSKTWFGRFATSTELRLQLPQPGAALLTTPAIYERGLAQFDPQRRRQLQLAQYEELAPTPTGAPALPPGMRRFRFMSRSDAANSFQTTTLPNGQRALLVSGGARLLIEGVAAPDWGAQLGPVGVLDISTDRAVVWTSGGNDFFGGSELQTQDAPLEIYMEGNIEFREGDRVLYADRMFYDVRRKIGVLLNAELLTPLPKELGSKETGVAEDAYVRLKAAVMRQLDESHFAASGTLVTTSRLEEPAYHFGADQILFTDVQQTTVNPRTGEIVVDHQQLAESQGNFLYLRNIPVFYWPTFATDLKKPSFLIDRVRVGNDSILGTQLMVDWDAYQLFGVRNAPEGTQWGLSTDLLTERGFGFGTDFQYDRSEIFGWEGPARGFLDFWALADDDGRDNLGLGRRSIDPEEDFRFHLMGEHRQRLSGGWEATGEVGWLSDRTFQEQFFEPDWDQQRSPRTGARLRHYANNRELSLEANVQVNDFFTQTRQLPRVDHYWLGESLLGDRFTWFAHSQAAYADLDNATAPSEPTLLGLFSPLPWEAGAGQAGERLVTRQEIDLPLQVGPAKVVPFALGELAHWGEALDGDSLQRAYLQTGVRASVPFWAVFPEVRDPLFNLNGLAHKIVWDVEFAYADATRNYDELPLYDELDDAAITEFRRRIYNPTLAPTIDPTNAKFDPRFYAIRSGMQSWVASPSVEMVDDLMVLRTGVRQRWQTKRGGWGRQHIVDWLTIDVNASWFPEANRDNFGQELGLLDYDLRWHLGDRFTIVSDGAADFFGDGLATASAGMLINRPRNGNAYFGVRTINGPISSNVLSSSLSYRLSEKWITTASAAFDLSNVGNIGQTFSMTRIGESLNVSAGVTVDSGKDNVGFGFSVEPRILPRSRLTRETGIEIPPVGAWGLE